ncbi:putative E3 SUMO-protein ligase RNF212 isoform X2 [Larimichthys crocea]|uniref:putative E3 SUMO-protein ligase RNF212 isoform X2 n=1 Tax=Larimichthys crocea TaxID=215358 RepID=UPI000901AB4B|nr:probable E3 SUMO-protein ligase RNF212 isoform X2 [Larimichthys crocea]
MPIAKSHLSLTNSEVKALFSDINVVATKHLTEISKVIMFQARHQKRLLTYYQQRNEKLEDDMKQMTRKLNEQSAYIAKLEMSLKHQSAKVSAVPQMSHSSHTSHGHKSVLQIPYNSPLSLSRHSSTTNVTENMEVDERGLYRNPHTVPRLSLISPPQNGRMGTVPHRSSNQSTLPNHSARSATVSRFQGLPVTPDIPYGQTSGWKSPIYRSPSSSSSFRHSMVFPSGPPSCSPLLLHKHTSQEAFRANAPGH